VQFYRGTSRRFIADAVSDVASDQAGTAQPSIRPRPFGARLLNPLHVGIREESIA